MFIRSCLKKCVVCCVRFDACCCELMIVVFYLLLLVDCCLKFGVWCFGVCYLFVVRCLLMFV